MKNIVLIGMMGCGKTTVGELLGKELKMPFIDVDILVEKAFGPIQQLFERGEDFFRNAESHVIDEISKLSGHVISTGGGVVLREKNMKSLGENGLIFFIDRPVDKIMENIDCSARPLLKNGPQALSGIYERRYPLYISFCDYHISSTNQVSDTVYAIKEILKNNGLLDS